MIRPADIQKLQFTKAVRGYKEEEVDAFLEGLVVDLDGLLNELRETKEENSRLVEELERIRTSEGSMVETLQAAKSLMSEISSSAEKRAEIVLKNAELDAELKVRSARDEAEMIAKESEAIKKRFVNFRNRYRELLKQELERFESLSGEILPEFGVDDFDDLPKGNQDDVDLEALVSRHTIQNPK